MCSPFIWLTYTNNRLAYRSYWSLLKNKRPSLVVAGFCVQGVDTSWSWLGEQCQMITFCWSVHVVHTSPSMEISICLGWFFRCSSDYKHYYSHKSRLQIWEYVAEAHVRLYFRSFVSGFILKITPTLCFDAPDCPGEWFDSRSWQSWRKAGLFQPYRGISMAKYLQNLLPVFYQCFYDF